MTAQKKEGPLAGGPRSKTNSHEHADRKTTAHGSSGVTFSYAVVDGVTDTVPKARTESWQAIVNRCERPTVRATKGGPLFTAATFRRGGHRRDADVDAVSLLVLDVDKGNVSREALRAKLHGLRYVAYTTHSSTPDALRWRAIIPLARPATIDEHRALYNDFAARLPVDRSGRPPSHPFYFPSVRPEQRENYACEVGEGELLEPVRRLKRRSIIVDFTGVPLAGRPEEVEEGARNGTLYDIVLTQPDALRCQTREELMDIAVRWNEQLSQPLGRREVLETVRKKWDWFQSPEGVRRRHNAHRSATTAPREAAEWERRLKAWKPKSTVADLLRVTDVEFLVREWIQSTHAGQLVAEGGVGKTTLLIYLGVSIATGRDWLGGEVIRPGTFVLLSLDDAQDDLDATLAQILQTMKLSDRELDLVRRRVRLISLRGCAVSFTQNGEPTGVAGKIAAALSTIEDIRCIALDTQRQFSGGDSNDDRVVMIAAQSVSFIAEQVGAACIVTHHVGKAQSRSGIDDMYVGLGSTAMADTLRFILRLDSSSWDEVRKALRVPEGRVIVGDVYRLSSKRGSLRMRPPEPIYFVRDGFRLAPIEYEAKTADERHADALARVVAAIDAAGGEVSANKLAEGKSRNKTLEQIRQFVGKGWLARVGDNGPLRVTPEGRRVSTTSSTTPSR